MLEVKHVERIQYGRNEMAERNLYLCAGDTLAFSSGLGLDTINMTVTDIVTIDKPMSQPRDIMVCYIELDEHQVITLDYLIERLIRKTVEVIAKEVA